MKGIFFIHLNFVGSFYVYIIYPRTKATKMPVKKENIVNDGDKSVNTVKEGSDLTDILHDEV
jgi:hypothetical protein